MVTRDTTAIRIRWTDYKKLRRIFPAYKYPPETAQSWFFRLRKYLEEMQE